MLFKKKGDKQLTKKNDGKISLTNFVVTGFGYIVGITFLGTCSIYASPVVNKAGETIVPKQLGLYMLLIFAFCGLIAYIASKSFGYLAKVYKADQNGGAYIYNRATFGRFAGILIGAITYITLPLYITMQIMSLIRGSFSAAWIGDDKWWGLNWGYFTNLYLDFISVAIYMSASCVVYFGIKLYKAYVKYSIYIMWIPTGLFILAGIYVACRNGSTNMQYWSGHSQFNWRIAMNAFTSCFFYFSGFEMFVSAGKNIDNPSKNIKKGITLIMIIQTIFYITLLIIFFAATQNFQQSEFISFWTDSFGSKILQYGGVSLMLFYAICMKINCSMQNGLFGGTLLQPLSNEGFISRKFNTLNKDDLPVRASILNQCISGAFILVWLIIPDIITGTLASTGHVEWQDQTKQVFDLGSMTEASTSILFVVYISVILCVLKEAYKGNIKINLFDWFQFIACGLVLAVGLVYHYYSVIDTMTGGGTDLISGVVEISTVAVVFGGITLWYFIYYTRHYNNVLSKDTEIISALEKQFERINPVAETTICE